MSSHIIQQFLKNLSKQNDKVENLDSSSSSRCLEEIQISINIQIKGETKLHCCKLNDSLSKIRQDFESNGIRIDEHMVFMTKDEAEISQKDEDKLKLFMLKYNDGDTLKVKELKTCKKYIADYSLKRCLNDEKDINNKTVEDCNQINSTIEKEVSSISYDRQFSINGKVAIAVPYVTSISNQYALSTKKQISDNLDILHLCNNFLVVKAVLNLGEAQLKEELENEIDKILALQAFYEKYGKFYIKKLFLGGKLTSNETHDNSGHNESRSNQASVGVGGGAYGVTANASVENKIDFKVSHNQIIEAKKFNRVGGTDMEIHNENDLKEWETSLSDEKNWEVVEHEVEPVFNLLSKEKRRRIIEKILGKKHDELKIGCIIVGYPEKVDYTEPKFMKNCSKRIDNKNNPIEIGHTEDYFPLISCVQEVDSFDSFDMSDIAIGIRFSNSGTLTASLFGYDIKSYAKLEKSWKRQWHWNLTTYKNTYLFYDKNKIDNGVKQDKEDKGNFVCIIDRKGFVNCDSKNLTFRYFNSSDRGTELK
ncbi:12990_t:CDS:2, partial [Racocetra fulgida]